MKKETFTKAGIWFGVIAASILVILGAIEWCQGHQMFFGAEKSSPLATNPPIGDWWGNYGSFLQGTTASLWSLAGFFIILVAFLAQKQQLTLQQRQFEQ